MKNSKELSGYLKLHLEPLRIKMGATTVVCGSGPLDSRIMIIGEAPGQEEDEQGMPFVGRSGALLKRLLDRAEIDRRRVYITNTVKCRPRDGVKNRPPTKEEISFCKPFLWKEMQEVRPKTIITLGLVPTRLLLRLSDKEKLSKYVGRFQSVDYIDATILPIWHPSFLLRTGLKYTDCATEMFIQARKSIEYNEDTKNNS